MAVVIDDHRAANDDPRIENLKLFLGRFVPIGIEAEHTYFFGKIVFFIEGFQYIALDKNDIIIEQTSLNKITFNFIYR
ncbi:hypothetical protein D3C84_980550 [compost metagenome]